MNQSLRRIDQPLPSLQARFCASLGEFNLDAEMSTPLQGVTALFGQSGSGKTSLLRCVAGLMRPENGFLQVDDALWQGPGCFLPPHRRPIGYVFQEASLLPHLSVRDNLQFGLRRARRAAIPFDQVVALLGIDGLLARMPDRLSGGERQRVAIGRALLAQPRLLLMDEPLSALDQQGKQEILPFLETVTRELKIPTLYVSHSLEEVCRLANHMVYLEKGRVERQGPITEVVPWLPAGRQQGDESALVEARVLAHDPGHGLSYLDLQGYRLSVTLRQAAIGETIRVRIPARDVALSLERPENSSMLNLLPVTLTGFAPLRDETRMLVLLRCGAVTLLAKITRKSFELLGLREGLSLYCQIKTVSLLQEERLL